MAITAKMVRVVAPGGAMVNFHRVGGSEGR